MLEVSSQLPVSGSQYPTVGTNPVVGRDDNFSKIGGIVGAAAAGGAASFKFSATFSSSLKSTVANVKATEGGFGDKFKATMPGVKSMGMTTLKAGGIGALVSGGVSAITNAVEVMQGKKTGADAVGTFVADTVNGTVGAMAGVMTGGLATFALTSMFTGLAGTPLMILGVGAGALGAILSDKLFKGSGAYDGIRNGLMGATQQN